MTRHFHYRKVLVVGATSGLGLALAERILSDGCKIIAVGRRQDRLDELQKKHGKDMVSTFKFDITNLDGVKKFAHDVVKAHPDLDCLLLNSGIQRGIDFSKPETIDLNIAQQEVTTNYTAYLYLLKYFLPHLIELSAAPTYKETSVILTTSGLALTPMKRCGNYCASKAALHQLIMTMREQLRDTGVRVIELLPPAVQTELHDSKNQPDIKNGGQIGMPLEQWLNTTWHGLLEEKESIPVGSAEKSWRWEEERYKDFIAMDQMFRKEGLA